MKIAKQLRAAGRADLSGHWAEAAMFTFVYFLISSLCGFTGTAALDFLLKGVGGGIITLLLLPMGWGFMVTFMGLHRKGDNDPFDLGHLLDGYRDFLRIFTTILLEGIYIVLWSLLLFIPGVVKSLSYSMTPYILRDRPDLKNNGAIELSMAMMNGHKVDLFWLELTFLGWVIACFFTLGIGFFWLQPYYEATMVNFYEEVKREFENGGYVEAEIISEESGDHYQK